MLGRGELRQQRVFRGQHHVRRPEDRVGPCGEHGDALGRVIASGIHHGELQLSAGAAADPVGLHRAHPLGPTFELIQVVEQLLRVVGDLEEPLAQLALFHQGAGAPGAALAIHLLVGEDGLIDRIPVDRRVLLIGEARLQELQEQPLGPAVVIGVAGGHFAIPVDREPELVQLLPHRSDVLVGPAAGIHTPFNGGVFGGQSEGIPAHRMQHLLAAQPLHPCHHIGDHVVAHMAHVQVPRGVGEHRQRVKRLITVLQNRGVMQAVVSPGLLPAGFDRLGLVAAALAHGRAGVEWGRVGDAPTAL